MKPTEEQIIEIADNRDFGMRSFFNIQTGELRALPDFSDPYAEPEMWEEDIDAIENDIDNYYEFAKMPSHESFQIMAEFAETVTNKPLQIKLVNALQRPKPFKNFKWHIDNAGDEREQWFAFKRSWCVKSIREQIQKNEADFA